MAPSVAELPSESQVDQVSDNLEQLKLSATGKQDVWSSYNSSACELIYNVDKNGPSYNFYLPYYDGNEKWPPTEVHGSSALYSFFLADTWNDEQSMSTLV